MSETKSSPLKEPGKLLELVVKDLDPGERAFFLQELERKSKAKGDMEALRAIREYRKLHSSPTSTPQPPAV